MYIDVISMWIPLLSFLSFLSHILRTMLPIHLPIQHTHILHLSTFYYHHAYGLLILASALSLVHIFYTPPSNVVPPIHPSPHSIYRSKYIAPMFVEMSSRFTSVKFLKVHTLLRCMYLCMHVYICVYTSCVYNDYYHILCMCIHPFFHTYIHTTH